MDELFRLTPAERRKRRILWLAAAGALVAIVAGAVAIQAGLRVLKKRGTPVPPAAYLVALEPGTTVRIQNKPVALATTVAIPEGASVEIPAGARAMLVYPKNGYTETVAGPATLRPEAPARPEENEIDILRSTREALAAARYSGPGEPTGRVLITSPFGVTRFINPVITWEPRPGTRYDVAVIDPSDPGAPPRIAVNMLPPVRIDQLETPQERTLTTDRIYNVIVREAGSETEVGAMRFLVSPDATDTALPLAPAELVAEALSALMSKPSRTGDGWLALSRLPPDWAESELVLRLRLRAAAELGLYGDIREIQRHLVALGNKP